jgi:hypothetical protein
MAAAVLAEQSMPSTLVGFASLNLFRLALQT